MPERKLTADLLLKHTPPCLKVLGVHGLRMNEAENTLELDFDVDESCCHSGNIVQGGFVTAMLDASMAHAVIMRADELVPVPTLDLHVSFFAPSLAGRFTAIGKIIRMGSSVGFLEASLKNEAGEITAQATSTVAVRQKRS